MFYRRKVLLALLEEFGGFLQNTDLQKILFILSNKQEKKAYHFVPYKFGCFSFQSLADKSALIKTGYLKDSEKWELTEKAKGMKNALEAKDRLYLNQVRAYFYNKLGKELITYVYSKYPYYAINSEIAQELLSSVQYDAVLSMKPNNIDPAFFTIGYEGISLEEYLNKLINNSVKVLCDVRKNALSKKFGFSKNELKNACNAVNIVYIHIPDLGIPSVERQNLDSQLDYNELFTWYESVVLPEKRNKLEELITLISQYNRVAITCFEECVDQCHRGRVAKALAALPNWNYKIIHL